MGRDRSGHAGRVALTAVLAAFSLIILYASALWPTGRLGLTALAGLLPAAAVVSAGLGAGALCYAGTGLLALLFLPAKENALLYLLFFGLYPLVKFGVERLRRLPLEILLKLVFFNAVLAVLWFGLKNMFITAVVLPNMALWLLWLLGNGIFLIYDFGFSKLIAFYVQRVDRQLRKGRT